ncbi:leucine-rich repeat-containing serine/threonine-protein kinase [Enterovibrio sp. ZSDZ35]|uniref:Leucine-rich repeat-containing serine/threonine-protein kinase n=1 Tax=Enterovibrio qingdaonensis TaxID=2899818 RepID=A0ABT5QT13_9GAMM|nr:leucine-rich repeat-containing protein kinase family protein [Enterovibrio sp. ZSDZ35]MDD1784118.1 leucine-rich repeat-containing serine/threonine-protein kinase [Enterovibrio sp. ZSDZ35]
MNTLSQLKSGELAGAKHVKLSENLTVFPPELFELKDTLEVLDLSGNQLSELPETFGQFQKLRIFFASDNLFTEVPEVLGACPNLEMVGFKSNQIVHVPEGALPQKLRWLILTNNQIETLPDSLGERPRLQKLALAGNRIAALPASMAKLENLELVRISANQLTACPDHLLALPKLAWLAFSGNPFSESSLHIDTVPTLQSSDYTLTTRLGQGASGVISQARWNQPQPGFPEDIAVKVFKGDITSDGYPKDELEACLKTGNHPNLVQSLGQVNEDGYLALIMNLIPAHFKNLGLPPSLESCTRDTFPAEFRLGIADIAKIVSQMESVFNHLHDNHVCHGDLYAHNTLFDDNANIIFGDFGAASMYHMLTNAQQEKVKQIEKRALHHFIDDLLSVCQESDRTSDTYLTLRARIAE